MYYFKYFKNAWPHPSKMIVSIYGKPYCSLHKKSTSNITSFYRFWVFRQVWPRPTRQFVYLHAKNQLNPSFLFWDIAKLLQNCSLGYFRHAWQWPVKTILPACKKRWCFPLCKKIFFIPLLSWNITKNSQSYFWYFRPAWPRPPKVTATTYRKLWCFSANKTLTESIDF